MKSEGNCGGGADQPTANEPRKAERHSQSPEVIAWHHGRAVHTPGMIRRVPNQPKTKIRGFRIPDELYDAARTRAAEEGEDLSKVVRAALERYVKKKPKVTVHVPPTS